jgi:hypothetical protein
MAVGENTSQKVTPGGTLSGSRLDRLPISRFHKRIFWLVGAGMFFDGYDLYVGTNVLVLALLRRLLAACFDTQNPYRRPSPLGATLDQKVVAAFG